MTTTQVKLTKVKKIMIHRKTNSEYKRSSGGKGLSKMESADLIMKQEFA